MGCTAYSTTDCAGSGQVCSEGLCMDAGDAGDTVGGDTAAAGDTAGGTGGTGSDDDSGSSSSGCGGAPGHGSPLSGLLASLLVLGLAIRRRA